MASPLTLLGLGKQGLATNDPREQLDPRQARVMSNVRSFQGKMQTAPGDTAILAGLGSGKVLGLLGWEGPDGLPYLHAGTPDKLYRVDSASGTLMDVTRASGAYNGSAFQRWDMATFLSRVFATNFVDKIQTNDPMGGALAIDLPGSAPQCGALSGFLTYLVLGDVSGDPTRIQWSDTGNPEAWRNPGDAPNGDAGFFNIYQGAGQTLRLLPLGNYLMVYRSTAIHLVYYVGPPFILGQQQQTNAHGLLAKMAVVDLIGRHAYWGTDNFYVTDGATRTPIGNAIVDDAVSSYAKTYADQIHATVDWMGHEVYWWYPPAGSSDGVPTKAWVWNYVTGGWRESTLRATASGTWKSISGPTWNSVTGDWASQVPTWAQMNPTAQIPTVALGLETGAFRFLDSSVVNEAGGALTRIAETGLVAAADVLARQGKPDFVDGGFAELQRLDIDQENKGAHNLEVSVGTQKTLLGDAGITWTAFTLLATGAVRSIFPRLRSRYFAFRFRTTGASQPWAVSGVTAWFAPAGDRP